jgi:hypothetical protein
VTKGVAAELRNGMGVVWVVFTVSSLRGNLSEKLIHAVSEQPARFPESLGPGGQPIPRSALDAILMLRRGDCNCPRAD